MTHDKDHEKEEDDVSIDFGKLAFWNKKKHKVHKDSEQNKERPKTAHEHTKHDEEESSDLSGHLPTLKKLLPVLYIILIIALMINFRMAASDLPAVDDWARTSITNYYRTQIGTQIDQQYPHLPDAKKQELVDTQLKQFLTTNKQQIDASVAQQAAFFKEKFRDENGYTYLADIDSYVWLREADNIVEKGHLGDSVKNGKQWDDYMVAPYGLYASNEMYPYVVAFNYNIMHAFNSHITLMRSDFFVPFIFGIIAIIGAFFIGRKIAGDVGGIFAAIIIAINPFLLSRTYGSDTDALVVTMPVLILWMFVEAVEAKEFKWGIVFAVLAGFFEGIYAWGWYFWYTFDFILIAVLLYLAYHTYRHWKSIRSKGTLKYINESRLKITLLVFLAFIISSAVFVTVFDNVKSDVPIYSTSGMNTFLKGPIQPFGFLTLKVASHQDLWPNVYTTVAELNPGSMNDAVSSLGGKLLFIISLLGILLLLFRDEIKAKEIYFMGIAFLYYMLLLWDPIMNLSWATSIGLSTSKAAILYLVLLMIVPLCVGLFLQRNKKVNTDSSEKLALLIAIWYAATLYANFSGIRFVLLLVPVFAVSFGIAIGIMYRHFTKWISEALSINKIVSYVVCFLLFALLLLPTVQQASAASKSMLPIMNDAWYDSLTKIKTDSAPDAIINSWWDFGHHFKYVARRRVTFDGASQLGPQAHWIGNTLATSDESRAVGTLRMLDCGANRAFEVVDSKLNDTKHSVTVINSLLGADDNTIASVFNEHNFTPDEKANISNYMFCAPPEDYFITSQDMVGKSGVWAHFGLWDFKKAAIWIKVKGMPAKDAIAYLTDPNNEFNYTPKEAEDLYYQARNLANENEANAWISPWPGYAGSAPCVQSNTTLVCQNGVKIDLDTKEVSIPTKDGSARPATFVYLDNGNFTAKTFDNNTIPLAIGLLKDNSIIVMSNELSQSMFTRMFFYDGAGLSHFEKFSDQTSVTGERIIVWKVKWD